MQDLRGRFGGAVILNSGFTTPTTREEAHGLVNDGLADAVAVGRALIANPDLVRRWRDEAELNEPDAKTFYGAGAVRVHGLPDAVVHCCGGGRRGSTG